MKKSDPGSRNTNQYGSWEPCQQTPGLSCESKRANPRLEKRRIVERFRSNPSKIRYDLENSLEFCNDFDQFFHFRYDLEITLGNLTASKPGHPVHLAWWAPRKSETSWNPHISLAGTGKGGCRSWLLIGDVLGMSHPIQLYRDYFINLYTDPYQTTRIQWKVRGFFSWLK